MLKGVFFLVIVFISIGIVYNGNAKDKIKSENTLPSAILVQLRSEQNRIKLLSDGTHNSLLNKLTSDATNIREAMKKDFSSNFHSCPVYFYLDSNVEFILEKKFKGFLFDEYDNIINIDSNISNLNRFNILFYGLPEDKHEKHKTIKQDEYASTVGTTHVNGLVINNEKLEQVDFIYIPTFVKLLTSKKHRKNEYHSKTFDMEYYPYAKYLEKAFIKKKEGKKKRKSI